MSNEVDILLDQLVNWQLGYIQLRNKKTLKSKIKKLNILLYILPRDETENIFAKDIFSLN